MKEWVTTWKKEFQTYQDGCSTTWRTELEWVGRQLKHFALSNAETFLSSLLSIIDQPVAHCYVHWSYRLERVRIPSADSRINKWNCYHHLVLMYVPCLIGCCAIARDNRDGILFISNVLRMLIARESLFFSHCHRTLKTLLLRRRMNQNAIDRLQSIKPIKSLWIMNFIGLLWERETFLVYRTDRTSVLLSVTSILSYTCIAVHLIIVLNNNTFASRSSLQQPVHLCAS